jgi:AcrR family transcriptional regulator
LPRRSEFGSRKERRQHILQVTRELIQRWGYKKTTIDDIARYANVAKGTIYLHWKTREDLFEELVIREWIRVMKEFRNRMSETPEAGILSNLIKIAIQVTLKEPLMMALMTGDNEILGNIAHSPTGETLIRIRMEHTYTFLQIQREKGLIRSDLDIETEIKMLAAISIGYFTLDQYMPEQFRFSPDEMAERLAETIELTFAPPEPPSPQAIQKATSQYLQLVQQLIDAVEQWYYKEHET